MFLGRAVRGVGGGAWWRWVCMEGWEGAVDCEEWWGRGAWWHWCDVWLGWRAGGL